ncbi:dirigent protein 19-like [Vitis riparia]|uniref:dirigent protein 19-like n=1 Tax=Vitis riparia TaxID=96939 RepID=UPI00155A0DC9|nr:dirigent protein 19-like [Vitis riparia]
MEKTALVLVAFSLAVAMAMPLVHSTIGDPKEVDEWLHKIQHAKQKMTRFHFYYHDIQNVSSMKVAQASITDKSPTFFGLTNMMDDPLTEGPELTSKQVGRAQGLYGLSGLNEFSLLIIMNLAFTSGEYNRSTLTILGRYESAQLTIQEMPIVGGSGVFRLAHGIASGRTYSRNATSGNAVVEFNIVAIHY